MTRSSLLAALLLAPLFAGLACAQSPSNATDDAPAEATVARQSELQPTVEDYAGYGRVIFPAPKVGDYRVIRERNRIVVAGPQGTKIAAVPRLPQNVVAVNSRSDATEILLFPGNKVGIHHVNGTLVINILSSPNSIEAASRLASSPTIAPEVSVSHPDKVAPVVVQGGEFTSTQAKAAAASPMVQAVAAKPEPSKQEPTNQEQVRADVVRSEEVRLGNINPIDISEAAPVLEAPSFDATPQIGTTANGIASKPLAAGVFRPEVAKADVIDPQTPPVAAPALKVAEQATAQMAQADTHNISPEAVAKPAPPIFKQALDVRATPTPAAAVPRAIAIERVVSPSGPGILLRTERDVGIAAFRLGSDVLIILDAAIDYQAASSSLAPEFAHLTTRKTESATIVAIPVASQDSLRFKHDVRGWIATFGAAPERPAVITPRLMVSVPDAATLRLPVSEPSQVVTILDPRSGDRLLVGTQRVPGEAVLVGQDEVQFGLLATLQGVVVAPKSDDIRLRREADGFTLSAGPHAGGKIISSASPLSPGTPPSLPLSQLFDIPNDTQAALYRQLNEQIDIAANAASLSRSAPRLRVAETMIALGMGVEALSVLDTATADDPSLQDRPNIIGLRAVASLLAHRPEGADTLADQRLNGTTEIEFWRSLLHIAKDQVTTQDGRSLSAAIPQIMAYPTMLRRKLLPETLETMGENGQAEAAQAVLRTLPDDEELDLARGIAAEMTNQPSEALRLYDQVAQYPDRLPSYRAVLRAVELRRKTGKTDAKGAADALDRALFGWRDARQEFPLRMHIADLRREAGQWPEALNMLREARADFPNNHDQIDREIATTLNALFTGDAAQRISPAAFVALYDKNLDLVNNMLWSETLGTKLVEHLISLGLEGRAEPVMARLVSQSTEPASRALLGARLSSLRMTLDDPAGAIAALSDTVPPVGTIVDPSVMDARQLLYARAESERGNKDNALAMLGTLDLPEADSLRADIFTSRKEWPQVVSALASLEQKRIGALNTSLTDEQQAIIMRIAEAATLGADQATLDRLKQSYTRSMENGKSAALFHIMTEAPIAGTEDLPRAFEEVGLAQHMKTDSGTNTTARP